MDYFFSSDGKRTAPCTTERAYYDVRCDVVIVLLFRALYGVVIVAAQSASRRAGFSDAGAGYPIAYTSPAVIINHTRGVTRERVCNILKLCVCVCACIFIYIYLDSVYAFRKPVARARGNGRRAPRLAAAAAR